MKVGQPYWDGIGLPPVGCVCEVRYLGEYNNNWMPFTVTAVTNDFVIGYIRQNRESAVNHGDPYVTFRPLLTKEQSLRQSLIDLIVGCDDMAYSFRPDDIADAILTKYKLEERTDES